MIKKWKGYVIDGNHAAADFNVKSFKAGNLCKGKKTEVRLQSSTLRAFLFSQYVCQEKVVKISCFIRMLNNLRAVDLQVPISCDKEKKTPITFLSVLAEVTYSHFLLRKNVFTVDYLHSNFQYLQKLNFLEKVFLTLDQQQACSSLTLLDCGVQNVLQMKSCDVTLRPRERHEGLFQGCFLTL